MLPCCCWPGDRAEIKASAGLRNTPAGLHMVPLLLLLSLLRYLGPPAAAGGWANATKNLLFTGTTEQQPAAWARSLSVQQRVCHPRQINSSRGQDVAQTRLCLPPNTLLCCLKMI
jgi:hypothetical protein